METVFAKNFVIKQYVITGNESPYSGFSMKLSGHYNTK
jgi:hypothetical protein